MQSNAAFPRLVTWLLLEGGDLSSVMSSHPLLDQFAVIAAESDADDPVTTAATLGLLAIDLHLRRDVEPVGAGNSVVGL